MADDASSMEAIGEVRKSRGVIIRVSVGDYQDRTYAYLKSFELPRGEKGEGYPRGGISLNTTTLKALMPLLAKALEVANAREGGRRVSAPTVDAEALMMQAYFDVEPLDRRRRR